MATFKVRSPGLSTNGTTDDLVRATGQELTLELDISDPDGDVAPSTNDHDVQVGELFGIEVVDVTVIKNGAGAGNTLTVKNGANAITDAIASAVDKAVTRAGTIDRVHSTIVAGGTLRFTVSRAAGTGAMRVLVRYLKRPLDPRPTTP